MDDEMQSVAPKRDFLLPGSILVAAVLISGSIFYLVGSQKSGGSSTDSTDSPQAGSVASGEVMKLQERDVVLGESDAPVTIIEYGDYQCPFCARFFEQTESLIRDQYITPGKVKMIYRNFTFIDTFPGVTGAESHLSAEAAECAKDQRQFWAYHDALYRVEGADATENNGNLNRALFLKLAGDLKLDVGAFTSCIDSRKYEQTVKDEVASASVFGVSGTPAIFINGVEVKGAQPFEYTGTDPQITPIKPIIESFLK